MSDFGDLVEKIIRRRCPELLYGGVYRYRVLASSANGRLDLEPVRTRRLGKLPKFYQWTGPVEVHPQPGSEAVVAFLDADPDQPIVLGLTPLQGAGGLPTSLRIEASSIVVGSQANDVQVGGGDVIDADGLRRVVRYGDPILFGSPGQGTVLPGAVLNHFSKVKA